MHASVCARVCLGISPSHPGMRASALAGGPGGSHRPPPGPICPHVAPQSSVETSVWGRAGTVELHDVSSRGEASSAVNFSFDLQEELLVKVPLYLVKGHTHTQNHCLYFSPVLPRSIFITQEKVLLWVRGCEVSDYDIGGAIFIGTEEHLAGAADIWFHSHGLKSRSSSLLTSASFGPPASPGISSTPLCAHAPADTGWRCLGCLCAHR